MSRIRQLVYPASLTALPPHLHHQDLVTMALNGASTSRKRFPPPTLERPRSLEVREAAALVEGRAGEVLASVGPRRASA